VLVAQAVWRQAAAAARVRIRAAYGEDIVCAQIEEMYSEMIDRSPSGVSAFRRTTGA